MEKGTCVKFLHCADIHLDSPLRGLRGEDGSPVEAIRGATRRALERIVQLAIDEQVSCVVIAGDLYDGDRDDFNTARFLQRQLERLRAAGIPVAIVYGNHDAESQITRRLRPPDNVHVFPTSAPETWTIASAGLAVHGQGYATRAVTDDLSAGYPQPVPGLLNIGVLHTSLDGRPGHEPYAPTTPDALAARGYAYWALGHVHEREVIHKDGTWIVFPGNPQGRHIRETGPRGATIVEYDGERILNVEERILDTVRWVRCVVDATDARDVDEALLRATRAVEDAVDRTDGRIWAVRVVLTVPPDLRGVLIRDGEGWEAQMRADLAGASALVWLERIDVRAEKAAMPAVAGDAGDAIAAVRSTIAAIASDPERRRELCAGIDELRRKLGSDLPALIELGAPGLEDASIAALLPDVEALVIAELLGGG
jgi:exonuclease SbcD